MTPQPEGPRSQGHRAYAAYVAAVEGRPVTPAITAAMWRRLLPREQRVWDETAAAVLAECTLDQQQTKEDECGCGT